MGFKENFSKKYAQMFIKKYGDRITQVQGRVLNVKVTVKTILWIYNKIKVDILVRPEGSKLISRSQYKKGKWFKKPEFMALKQGDLVVVQGIKGKKGKENSDVVQIMNVMNLTTKKDLVPVDQKIKRVQQRQFIR